MEMLELPVAELLAEDALWGDPPPPRMEEQELDILAFELWRRASRQEAAAVTDSSDEEEVVGSHASCL